MQYEHNTPQHPVNSSRSAADNSVSNRRSRPAGRSMQRKGNAGDTNERHVVTQLIKITKDQIPSEAVWEELEEFHGGFEDEFETDSLSKEDVVKLKAKLVSIGKQDLADQITDGTGDAPISMKDLAAHFKIEAPKPNPLLVGSTPYKTSEKYGGPESPIMKEIWTKDYKEAEKEYKGAPSEIKGRILADPAINLLFNQAATFLEVIGWKTMSIPLEGTENILSIRLAFFDKSKFTIHTSFPNGMQDTTLTYSATGGKSFQVTEVYRHRSMKEKDTKDNFFINMIEEQATGVQKLGKDVNYLSHAIKSPEGYGYNVWPKMGFDADVPEAYLQKMVTDEDPLLKDGVKWLKEQKEKIMFSTMFSVEDDTIYKQLKLLWRKHGDTVEVSFDPREGSASWKTLARFKKGAGKS
jgi:hypothetical protein